MFLPPAEPPRRKDSVQGLNLKHLAACTSSLLENEKLEWEGTFAQDNENMNGKGRILTQLFCHPTFCYLLSGFLSLGP